MPGMAANPLIFEHIELPEDQFEMHYLEWIIPFTNEALKDYAQRINAYIKHENIVLIGVSFGGLLVQEMSNYLNLRRLIIISSVKSRQELPRRMRYAGSTGFIKLLPTSLLYYSDYMEKFAIGDYLKKRIPLYRRYLSIRNTKYIDWAIKNMVNWNGNHSKQNLIHIHGDKDEIFPYKYIKGCITVKGGTHIMIVNRYKWFNEYLPGIILTGNMIKQQN